MFDAATAISLPPAEAYASLQEIIAAAHDAEAAWYPQWWASDALVLMGEYRRAAEEYPPPSSARSTMQTERLLSLKSIVGIPYVARDMVALLGPKVTTFGRQNLGLVTAAVETLIAEESSEQRTTSLRRWTANAVARPYQVYIGSPYGYDASKSVSIKSYSFSDVAECVDYCLGIMRRAENMVRQEAGVPGVGEGWISETALFREIQSAFPSEPVQQHASPPWLGRQHLDVYLPDRKVGVEFQGLQHDEPVAYFGGEESYLATRKRDARKKSLCTRNGIVLVYVRPGYVLADVIAEIAVKSTPMISGTHEEGDDET